jgi:hypothetical protein
MKEDQKVIIAVGNYAPTNLANFISFTKKSQVLKYAFYRIFFSLCQKTMKLEFRKNKQLVQIKDANEFSY